MSESEITFKEISIKLDTRVLADLKDSISVRAMLGQTTIVEASFARILKAMEDGKLAIELRYKSDNPNFRGG